MINGRKSEEIAKSHHIGSKKYTDTLDELHPGYLHFLFRSSLKIIGNNASFNELSVHMNVTSGIEKERRETVELTRKQVAEWFKRNSGKLISPVEKPLDTPEHCKQRIR